MTEKEAQRKKEVEDTPAAKFLQTLTDGLPFGKVLDGFKYDEALAILDSIMAEIKTKTLGGKGYMDAAEDRGTRIDFEEAREGVFYPYRRPGIDSQGCRVVVYQKLILDGEALTQFIESKVSFFESLNESARAEFIRQIFIVFNERQLSELLKKHDSTFGRDTSSLQEKLEKNYMDKSTKE